MKETRALVSDGPDMRCVLLESTQPFSRRGLCDMNQFQFRLYFFLLLKMVLWFLSPAVSFDLTSLTKESTDTQALDAQTVK